MQKTKIKNIKDLCEYIWYLEEKYDLFNLEINKKSSKESCIDKRICELD